MYQLRRGFGFAAIGYVLLILATVFKPPIIFWIILIACSIISSFIAVVMLFSHLKKHRISPTKKKLHKEED